MRAVVVNGTATVTELVVVSTMVETSVSTDNVVLVVSTTMVDGMIV